MLRRVCNGLNEQGLQEKWIIPNFEKKTAQIKSYARSYRCCQRNVQMQVLCCLSGCARHPIESPSPEGKRKVNDRAQQEMTWACVARVPFQAVLCSVLKELTFLILLTF